MHATSAIPAVASRAAIPVTDSRQTVAASRSALPTPDFPAAVPVPDTRAVVRPPASRRLAAHLLEAQLLRLVRAGAVIERRLGPLLLALSAPRVYRRLGFVRLGDYLTERLGMRLQRCLSILRLERALRDLPAVAAAFDAGALPPSKVRIVASAATPTTQDLWLARAQRLTVRDLEAAVRAARQQERSQEADPVSSEAGQGGTGIRTRGRAESDEVDTAPPEAERDGPGRAVFDAARAGSGSAAPDAATDSAPEDEPGVLISFAAPGRAFALWHWALEFVRRVAGRQEPAWRCAEYLAAEFLSGCPDPDEADPAGARFEDPRGDAGTGAHVTHAVSADPEDPGRFSVAVNSGSSAQTLKGTATESALLATATGSVLPATRTEFALPPPPTDSTLPTAQSGGDVAPASAPLRRPPRDAISDEVVWARAVAAVREALQSLGSAADVESLLSAPPPSPPASDPDPWELDARLRRFVRLRQSLAWRQGRLLAAVAAADLHRDLGYDALGDWCQRVLGMSPRRARYLVSLDRRLRRLPLVADAYRRGLVSWCQARLLVRVARPGTESRWIRYARQVTVRRLEDAVTACAVAAADPALGDRGRTSQDGASLPPTDPLPERHTLAPAAGDGLASAGDVGDTTRHTWAPPTGTSALSSDADSRVAARHTLASGNPAGAPVATQPARHTLAPEPCTHRIAFWAPLDVAAVWRSALRACRRARGPHLRDWECLLLFILEMRDAWQPDENAAWRRRTHILDRDGWRCRAPGCTSRSHLNAHHIVFRSHRGGDDPANLVTLCVGHHQAGVHDGLIRIHGRAPDALWWELGVRPDGPPLVRTFGERIVGPAGPAGPRHAERPMRTEMGRRGDPPSRPPVRGEPWPRTGSEGCRPLAELRQEGAAPRAPGL